jgi:WD40 repeat protein
LALLVAAGRAKSPGTKYPGPYALAPTTKAISYCHREYYKPILSQLYGTRGLITWTMARLFISHSSGNNAAAMALKDWLSEQGYDDVFLDLDPDRGLAPGVRWQEALKAAADRCEAVLFLVSPAWLASKWCLAEFLLAKNLHKRIFGLIIEPVEFEQIPVEMAAEWQLCELVGEDRLRTFEIKIAENLQRVAFRETGLDLLRRGLERAGLDARSFPWPPRDDPHRAPYRGLSALEPQDAAVFFGRDAAIVRGLDRIRGLRESGIEKMLVVLGGSGSGKSSFLRAGLWPRLARDDAVFLPLPVIRPEAAVISGRSGLAVVMAAAFARLGVSRTPGAIKQALSQTAPSFLQMLDELAGLAKRRLVGINDVSGAPTIVLCVDQAEELFNADGAEEAAAFLDLVADVLTTSSDAARRVLVIATVRSDRYELLQSRLASVKQDLFNLPPLPLSEFKGVIEGPARRVSEAGGRLAVDPALTERLIADAQGADALPLLGFTLERLYADFGGDGRLTLADYEIIGGMQGSIAAAVACALAEPGRLPVIPADKETQLARLRAAFIPWLARIDPETGAAMRRVARLSEIPESSRAMVERLVASRLLVADRRDRVDVIEVAHESLLRQWPALASWLEADAHDLKVIEGVERAAGEWARNGRLQAWLDHRAERLAAADKLAMREDFRQRMGEDGVAYLAACHAREDAERKEKEEALAREQARLAQIATVQKQITAEQGRTAAAQTRTARMQRRAKAALIGVGLLVFVMLGNVLWQQHDTARREMLVYTSLAAQALKDEQFDRAIRYALQGYPAPGAMPWAPFSTELEGKLAGAAMSSRLLHVFKGHGARINTAAFSPDASRVITASEDGTARLWDVESGKEIAVLNGHTKPVASAGFSPDGKRVVTVSHDQTARLWDGEAGNEIAVLKGHRGPVRDATFSPDGKRVVTSSDDNTARIWDVESGKEVVVLRGHSNFVRSAAFGRDGKFIVTASEDNSARLWDNETGKELAILRGHGRPLVDAAFSPDGDRVVTASEDNTARVWDAWSGKEIAVLNGHTNWVVSAAFSPDGTRVVTASDDSTARVWNADTGTEIIALQGHTQRVSSAAFSPDGKRVATASDDTTIRFWDIEARGEIAVLKGHARGVTRAVFNRDGTRILTASEDRTARVWKVEGGTEAVLPAHTDWIHSVAFSRDGRRLVTASSDRTAVVWDFENLKAITTLNGHLRPVLSAAFSPDGMSVVTASEDATVRLWNTETGKEIAVLKDRLVSLQSAAFSPDGKRLVTASSDKARVWDIAAGEVTTILVGHRGLVRTAKFSTDGKRVVTASNDGTARLWNAEGGSEIAVFKGHTDAVRSAAFSIDGKRLVTASEDATARIWDVERNAEIAVLRGHTDQVFTAMFSPDGKRVATVSYDNTARVWDVDSGKEMAVLKGHTSLVRSGDFSRDGKRLVTASWDRTVRVWDIEWASEFGGKLRERACRDKLIGSAQEFNSEELGDPILNDIKQTNPCLRRGPLALGYWTELFFDWTASAGAMFRRAVPPGPAH